ncbi:MAG: hypothetical protein ACYDGS_00030 [Thermoleophilia bacterium]
MAAFADLVNLQRDSGDNPNDEVNVDSNGVSGIAKDTEATRTMTLPNGRVIENHGLAVSEIARRFVVDIYCNAITSENARLHGEEGYIPVPPCDFLADNSDSHRREMTPQPIPELPDYAMTPELPDYSTNSAGSGTGGGTGGGAGGGQSIPPIPPAGTQESMPTMPTTMPTR